MTKTTLRVCILISGRGIGGAERSMLRLIEFAHPEQLEFTVVFCNGVNPDMEHVLQQLSVYYTVLSPFAWKELRSIISQIQPDVVYMFGQVRTLAWALIAASAGVRAIVGAERGSGTRLINLIGRRLDKWFIDAYITNTQQTANVLNKRAGISVEKLFIAHNGISPVKVEQRNRPAVYGSPTIICVANIRPLKGQHVLVEAAAQLRSLYPKLKVVLIGRDLTNGAFLRQMITRDWTEFIVFEGFVQDVYNYLQLADVFVLPTVSREGMPTAILEAMRAGLPVISTDVGGVTELVKHGETGIIIPPNNINELAQALKQLLESSERRRSLGEAGASYVMQHHTMESMLKAHCDAFNYALSRRGDTSCRV